MPKHEHDWVTRRIAVGSGVCNVEDVAALIREGITHVVDCRMFASIDDGLYQNPSKLYIGTPIQWVHCPTNDPGVRPKPFMWFQRGVQFALEALIDPKARVLIHCDHGINRGPSMVYALLRVSGLAGADAERAIRRARDRIKDPAYGLSFMPDAEASLELLTAFHSSRYPTLDLAATLR